MSSREKRQTARTKLVNAGVMTLEHARREDLADEAREAADALWTCAAANDRIEHWHPQIQVLVDHARTTSPAPEVGDLAATIRAELVEQLDGLDNSVAPSARAMRQTLTWAVGVVDRVIREAPAPSVATPPQEGDEKPGSWIKEEFERARERMATVPPHARPMWTRGSFGDRGRFDAPSVAAPPQEGEGAVMLRTIADGLDPEPCPGGCGCRWLEDAEAAECGCDGGCCDEGWDRPERPDDPEDVLYSLNDLRRVLGHPSLSLEHALAAAANRLRTPAAPPAEAEKPGVPTYWRAEIARAGGHSLDWYDDPERGWVDPLDDSEQRDAVRRLLRRMAFARSAPSVAAPPQEGEPGRDLMERAAAILREWHPDQGPEDFAEKVHAVYAPHLAPAAPPAVGEAASGDELGLTWRERIQSVIEEWPDAAPATVAQEIANEFGVADNQWVRMADPYALRDAAPPEGSITVTLPPSDHDVDALGDNGEDSIVPGWTLEAAALGSAHSVTAWNEGIAFDGDLEDADHDRVELVERDALRILAAVHAHRAFATRPKTLAAGDTVENEAQLDALPIGTIVEEYYGVVGQRVAHDVWQWTARGGTSEMRWPGVVRYLPPSETGGQP